VVSPFGLGCGCKSFTRACARKARSSPGFNIRGFQPRETFYNPAACVRCLERFRFNLTHVLAALQAAGFHLSLHRAEALCFARPGLQPEDATK
jgi:hypothetical protein